MNVIKYPQNVQEAKDAAGMCPLCESKRNKFKKDYFRNEVYCGVCGCVLIDNALPSISRIILSLDHDDGSDVNDDEQKNILKNFIRE